MDSALSSVVDHRGRDASMVFLQVVGDVLFRRGPGADAAAPGALTGITEQARADAFEPWAAKCRLSISLTKRSSVSPSTCTNNLATAHSRPAGRPIRSFPRADPGCSPHARIAVERSPGVLTASHHAGAPRLRRPRAQSDPGGGRTGSKESLGFGPTPASPAKREV